MSVDVRVALIRRSLRDRPHPDVWLHPPTAMVAARSLRLAASVAARDPSLPVLAAVRASVMECAPGDWSDDQVEALVLALSSSGW